MLGQAAISLVWLTSAAGGGRAAGNASVDVGLLAVVVVVGRQERGVTVALFSIDTVPLLRT